MRRLIFLIIFSSSAEAFFADGFYDVRLSAMAGSCAAQDMFFSFTCNPATGGSVRETTTGISYIASNFSPSGYGSDNVSFAISAPSRINVYNTTYSMGYISSSYGLYDAKSMYLSAATWRLKDYGKETLDGGISIKSLSLDGPSGSDKGIAADLGAILRIEDLNIGFSAINFKTANFSKNSARAAKVIKFGAARIKEDYLISADLTKRDYPDNNYTLSGAVKRLFRTYEGGTFSVSAGLGAGDNKSFLSLGAGYEKMAYSFSYVLIAPLNGAFSLANGLSFVFRFGSSQEESEYQRLIAREMKFRRDLMLSLDRSEQDRLKLLRDLEENRKEIKRLYEIIKDEKGKISKLEETKNRLDELIRRHNQSKEELRILQEKRSQERIKQIEENYTFDWKNYIKMKSSGASSTALKGYLQKLINQYQNQGIDISDAVLELQRLNR